MKRVRVHQHPVWSFTIVGRTKIRYYIIRYNKILLNQNLKDYVLESIRM